MNEYLDPMFPDTDHLRKFPVDANTDNPKQSDHRSRRSSVLLNVRPGAYLVAIAIGVGLACAVALCSGCKTSDRPCLYDAKGHVNTPCVTTPESTASEKRFHEAVEAERKKLLKQQQKDFDKKARDFRTP